LHSVSRGGRHERDGAHRDERWTQALNVWALEAWRARTEEPVESVTRHAA
jgi:hypothetical protein